MSPQEFADRLNVVRAAGRRAEFADSHQKISVYQADWILKVLANDGHLTKLLGEHLYGPMVEEPAPPAPETEEQEMMLETVESKLRSPAVMRATNNNDEEA
jgi:hypothetical protein